MNKYYVLMLNDHIEHETYAFVEDALPSLNHYLDTCIKAKLVKRTSDNVFYVVHIARGFMEEQTKYFKSYETMAKYKDEMEVHGYQVKAYVEFFDDMP